jgi:hypothetical protein
MPISFKIDKDRRLVMGFGSGVVTKEDMLAGREQLLKDPDFDPSFSLLQDYTQIAESTITPDDVRQLARTSIYSPASRRALVMKDDASFGLARMFETHRELGGHTGVRIFRNIDEALDWVLAKDAVT